jgi:cobalt-zinc-cadmium efflux system outer membrane protein
MRLNTLIVLWAGLLLGGCATFHDRPLLPEKTATAFEARNLQDQGLKSFMEGALGQPLALWPPVTWDLDSLTLAAYYYHPDLDIARAQWEVARAGEKTAKERPNPSFNLGSELYATNPPIGVTPWVFPFTLDIPVETAGKRGIRTRQAAALSEAARLNIAQAAWQVRSRVRAQLLNLVAAQESSAILENQQKALSENERLMTQRASEGGTSPLNAAQAVVLSGRNRLALEDAHRQETSARAGLGDALGVPIRALDSITLSTSAYATFPSPEDPTLVQARRVAMVGRADLLSALATYAASQAALQLEIARQYPDVHLGPGYMYDQGEDKWGLGLTIPIPILSQNRGPIAEAKANRLEAAARFLALQDKIINDIDRAAAEYRASYHKLQTADHVLEADLRQDLTLRRLLRPGDVSRLTLFRSQLDIDSSRLARADAWTQAQQALGVLEDALEQPLTPTRLSAASFEKDPRGGKTSGD